MMEPVKYSIIHDVKDGSVRQLHLDAAMRLHAAAPADTQLALMHREAREKLVVATI